MKTEEKILEVLLSIEQLQVKPIVINIGALHKGDVRAVGKSFEDLEKQMTEVFLRMVRSVTTEPHQAAQQHSQDQEQKNRNPLEKPTADRVLSSKPSKWADVGEAANEGYKPLFQLDSSNPEETLVEVRTGLSKAPLKMTVNWASRSISRPSPDSLPRKWS